MHGAINKHNVGAMHKKDLETTWMTQCYNMMHQAKDDIMQNDERLNVQNEMAQCNKR